ncbi:MAG: hypothetical protein HC780_29125 [Leptolyngbyaceae cyanobacterium CSU_1_3]|nr:hypothetical protein [Leptolyngbyaceae cyanobacterium CSU_1_3]
MQRSDFNNPIVALVGKFFSLIPTSSPSWETGNQTLAPSPKLGEGWSEGETTLQLTE